MATLLEKTLKREVSIGGRAYILAISPEGLKLTHKGRRKGLELQWDTLVSGDAALAVALNETADASVSKPHWRYFRPTNAHKQPACCLPSGSGR
jgi:hypothetical protein